jgi:aryl-alcohol dehydrogenase-like predicted oxidoreductase
MSDESLQKAERLKDVAKARGVSLVKLALAWCLQKSIVSSVIIGATRPEQVEENAAASGITLSQQELDEMEAILS